MIISFQGIQFNVIECEYLGYPSIEVSYIIQNNDGFLSIQSIKQTFHRLYDNVFMSTNGATFEIHNLLKENKKLLMSTFVACAIAFAPTNHFGQDITDAAHKVLEKEKISIVEKAPTPYNVKNLLISIPNDKYTIEVQQKIEQITSDVLNTILTNFKPLLSQEDYLKLKTFYEKDLIISVMFMKNNFLAMADIQDNGISLTLPFINNKEVLNDPNFYNAFFTVLLHEALHHVAQIYNDKDMKNAMLDETTVKLLQQYLGKDMEINHGYIFTKMVEVFKQYYEVDLLKQSLNKDMYAIFNDENILKLQPFSNLSQESIEVILDSFQKNSTNFKSTVSIEDFVQNVCGKRIGSGFEDGINLIEYVSTNNGKTMEEIINRGLANVHQLNNLKTYMTGLLGVDEKGVDFSTQSKMSSFYRINQLEIFHKTMNDILNNPIISEEIKQNIKAFYDNFKPETYTLSPLQTTITQTQNNNSIHNGMESNK